MTAVTAASAQVFGASPNQTSELAAAALGSSPTRPLLAVPVGIAGMTASSISQASQTASSAYAATPAYKPTNVQLGTGGANPFGNILSAATGNAIAAATPTAISTASASTGSSVALVGMPTAMPSDLGAMIGTNSIQLGK